MRLLAGNEKAVPDAQASKSLALASRTATVALKGSGGHATVRAEDELAASINGPGRVDYYGQLRLTERVSPMGVVTHLIEIAEVAAR